MNGATTPLLNTINGRLPKEGIPPSLRPSSSIQAVHAHPHQVSIIAASPLTNIALALRFDPGFANITKELVFMRGFIDASLATVTDSTSFTIDFNIMMDPGAAHTASHCPMAVHYQHCCFFQHDHNDGQADESHKCRSYASHCLSSEIQGISLPLWDEVTTTIAIHPSRATHSIEALMNINTTPGMDYGHTHIWPLNNQKTDSPLNKVRIIQTIY